MNPLDQLNDIVLPEPIGWWPLAWGWWAIIVFSVVILGASIMSLYWRKKQTAYRRDGIRQLQHLYKTSSANTDTHYAFQLITLIKNTAVSSHPFTSASNTRARFFLLHQDLKGFLRLLQQASGKKNQHADKLDQQFQNYYQKDFSIDRQASYMTTLQWIKNHDAKALYQQCAGSTSQDASTTLENAIPAPTSRGKSS